MSDTNISLVTSFISFHILLIIYYKLRLSTVQTFTKVSLLINYSKGFHSVFSSLIYLECLYPYYPKFIY